MTAERQEPYSLERPQTPDQHPLSNINKTAKQIIDLYVGRRIVDGATSSRIIWPDGVETYSQHPDGSRRLIARFTDFSLEVKERTVLDGKETGATKEEITYSNGDLNLRDSEEAVKHITNSIYVRIKQQETRPEPEGII